MNALVLVGGQGTRLRPVTYDIPKPMLPVVDRPMIFQIIEWLARYGVTKVVFALGYQSAAFLAAFAGGTYDGVEVVTAVEPEPLDTAGAIAFAADIAGIIDERLVVINGDILTDLDLKSLIEFHERHHKSATIALTPVLDPSAFGVVPTDLAGRVLAFIEKPSAESAPTNMINAGTYILEPSVLARIPRGVPVSIERKIFPELVVDGELYALASDCYWLDTGTPERYLRAQRDVLGGKRPTVILPDHVEISPGVRAGIDAEVKGEVTGASYLGARSVVARSALVSDSIVGTEVVVGEGARLFECVVMAGALIEPGTVLERSIIGPGARIGANCVVTDSIIGAKYEVKPDVQLDGARLPE